MAAETVEQDPVLLRARAFAHIALGRFDYGVRDAERATLLCSMRDDPVGAADAGLDVAYALRERTNWEASAEWLARVEAGPVTPTQRLRLLNLRIVEAISHHHDADTARRLHAQVEDIALKTGDTMALLTSVINRALGLERLTGRYDRMWEAAATIERVYSGRVPAEDEHYRRRILAVAAFDTGSDVEAAVALLGELGDRSSCTYADALGAMWMATRGKSEVARELAERALRSAYPGNVALLLAQLTLSRLHASEGRRDQALVILREAEAETEEPAWRMTALIEASKIALLAHDPSAAERYAESAITVSVEHGSPFFELRARVVLAAIRYRKEDFGRIAELAASMDYGSAVARRDSTESALVFARMLERGIAVERVRAWMAQSTVVAKVIRLIGPTVVVVGGRVLSRNDWSRPRARSLFAYLAYHDGPVPVTRVLEDLWPGTDEDAARRSLKVACSYVRRALGEDVVAWSDGHLRLFLGDPCWVDVRAIRNAARSTNPDVRRRIHAETRTGVPFEDFAEPWAEAARDELLETLRSLGA